MLKIAHVSRPKQSHSEIPVQQMHLIERTENEIIRFDDEKYWIARNLNVNVNPIGLNRIVFYFVTFPISHQLYCKELFE